MVAADALMLTDAHLLFTPAQLGLAAMRAGLKRVPSRLSILILTWQPLTCPPLPTLPIRPSCQVQSFWEHPPPLHLSVCRTCQVLPSAQLHRSHTAEHQGWLLVL